MKPWLRHNKPHTEETKKKIREKQRAWRKTKSFSDFVERQRRRAKNSKTKFKKGHKPLTNGMNLLNYQKGQNHWNWRGGITNKSHLLRQSSKYKLWRDKIFRRDDYTCQICGIRGVYLEADHYPIPWCVIFDEKNWDLMWDIHNGRTLCRKCHDSTKNYWKKYYEKP